MRVFVVFCAFAVFACGGSSYDSTARPASAMGGESYGGGDYEEYAEEDYGYGSDDSAPGSIALDSAVRTESAPASYNDSNDWDFEDENASGPVVAQAAPTAVPEEPPPPGSTPDTARPTSDAIDTSGPLLIYQAEIHLGVFEVEQTQEAILARVAELNGFMQHQSDTRLVVRVPARNFRAALESVEGSGDLIHRNVEATDVGEEFRDLIIRIRNAEAMRDRFEQLLARADSVEAALSIERELHRLTDLIETMKGRQRFLADRISLSTITIHFRARGTEGNNPDDGFRLPFDWLNQLGLSELLTL